MKAKRPADPLAPIERWWVARYGLPLSDPSFENQTRAGLLLDFLYDMQDRREQIHQRLLQDSVPPLERDRLEKALEAAERILAVQPEDLFSKTGDQKVDRWLELMAEDKLEIEDLAEGLPKELLAPELVEQMEQRRRDRPKTPNDA